MKKNELKELERKRKKTNYSWIVKITILAFIISIIFSFGSEKLLPNVNLILGIILVLIVIIIGIIFDMIGVAVAAADSNPFHSMSSRRVYGSKVSVYLIKNASKVSSFCNDVIGDVCGVISGTAGVIIANKLSIILNADIFIITLLTTALIAALTIGGKALGKTSAINNSNFIVYRFSKLLSIFIKK